MRDIATGAPLIDDSDMDAFIAAPTPLAFWRKQRGLTQSALAEAAGMTQSHLSQMETGQNDGAVAVYRALAHRLGMRIDDLVG